MKMGVVLCGRTNGKPDVAVTYDVIGLYDISGVTPPDGLEVFGVCVSDADAVLIETAQLLPDAAITVYSNNGAFWDYDPVANPDWSYIAYIEEWLNE